MDWIDIHFSGVLDKLKDKLVGWFDQMILILPNMLIGLFFVILFYWLSKHVQRLLLRVLKRFIVQASIRDLISNIASIIVILFGFLLALSVLNLDGTLKSLLAGAGVAGLAISLALQGTLSNTFSGIFIALKDEVQVGDWIETNGYYGQVVETNLRNTKLIEIDNNTVILPNISIQNNPLKNYSSTKRYRACICCGIGYESNLAKVQKLVVEMIEKKYPQEETERVQFFYRAFGDSSINFELYFWVNASAKLEAYQIESDVIIQIKELFDANGINIPFPIRTLIHQNLPKE